MLCYPEFLSIVAYKLRWIFHALLRVLILWIRIVDTILSSRVLALVFCIVALVRSQESALGENVMQMSATAPAPQQ
eukprot:830006-Amphidinium_carterae.1